MTTQSNIYRWISAVIKTLNQFDWIPIILVRLTVGGLFFESGMGKLFFKLEELGEFFVKLGIPFPHLNAFFVALVEFVGGFCLIIGVLTRFVSAQLAVIMVVAIATSEIAKVKTLGDFLYLPEMLLLVLLVWLVFSGAGKASIDSYLGRKLEFE